MAEPRTVGFWAGKMRYVILDMDTGRDYPIMIPGMEQTPPLYEPSELEDLVAWQTEQTIAQIKKEKANPNPIKMMTRDQQHDLGHALLEVKASKKNRLVTGHGRYW